MTHGAYTIAKDVRGQPDLLGRGGFSSVYLARHASFRGDFALKLLDPLPGNDRGSLTRFKRELDAARRVNSSYVARVFEWQLDGEQPWIAMQYVPGQTLRDVLRGSDKGRIPLGDALTIAHQVALAIADLDRVGVTHRDITPSNIMISPGLNVTVIDLGLALAPQAERVTSYAVGTLDYMSPEALRGGTQMSKSDLWSLGIMLARIASGRLPFKAANDALTIDLIRDAPPEVFTVPSTIRSLVRKLLQKDPDDRPLPHRVAKALEFLSLGVAQAGDNSASKPRDRLNAAVFRCDRLLVGQLVAAGIVIRDIHRYPLDPLIDIGEIQEVMNIVKVRELSGDDLSRLAFDAELAGAPTQAIELFRRALNAVSPMTRRDNRFAMCVRMAKRGYTAQALQMIEYLDNPYDRFAALEVAAYASGKPEILGQFRDRARELDTSKAAGAFSKLALTFNRPSDIVTFRALAAQMEPAARYHMLEAHARKSGRDDDARWAIENGTPPEPRPREDVGEQWEALRSLALHAGAYHSESPSPPDFRIDNPLTHMHVLLQEMAAADPARARELFDLCRNGRHRPQMHVDMIRATGDEVAANAALSELTRWAQKTDLYENFAPDLASVGRACLAVGLTERARECLRLIKKAVPTATHYDVVRFEDSLLLQSSSGEDVATVIDRLLEERVAWISAEWVNYLERLGMLDDYAGRLHRRVIELAADRDGSNAYKAPYGYCQRFAAALLDDKW